MSLNVNLAKIKAVKIIGKDGVILDQIEIDGIGIETFHNNEKVLVLVKKDHNTNEEKT